MFIERKILWRSQMKRILSVLLAAVLAAAVIAFPAAGDGEDAVVFTVEWAEAEPGETASVTVSVSGGAEFSGLMLTLNYDPALVCTAAECSEFVGDLTDPHSEHLGMVMCEDVPDSHQVRFILILGLEDSVLEGDLFTVSFTVPADAEPGDRFLCQLSAEEEDVFVSVPGTLETLPIPFTLIEGGVSIPASYTVVFENWDGSELSRVSAEQGETPEYSGTAPTREPSDGFIYVFAGWSPAIVPAAEDATYTAVFLKIKDVTGGRAAVSVTSFDPEGNTVFTVVNGEDLACRVGVMNADGTVTRLACTDANGLHTFTAPSGAVIVIVIKGDFDLNGKLQSRDATYMRQYLLDLRTLNEETAAISLFAGDVVGTDNSVSSRDATLIRQVLLEIKEPFAW